MKIVGGSEGQAWVFAISGRLDAQSSGEAEVQMRAWLGQGQARLVGDLSDLDYISSAGLRVMLVAAKAAKAAGGGVCVFGLKDSVRAVFDISGFSAIIPVATNRDEALTWSAGQA